MSCSRTPPWRAAACRWIGDSGARVAWEGEYSQAAVPSPAARSGDDG